LREFDPLKSAEVGEDITGMHWLKPQGKYLKLVTTNARNMKMWKLYEKADKKVVKLAGKDLNMPKMQSAETNCAAELQRTFPSKHLSAINSTSASCNEQYLLTSDEAQVFFWSLEDASKPYVVADLLQKQELEDMK
jgi:serine/threonine-protein phosphatase 2A regulatory subunit B